MLSQVCDCRTCDWSKLNLRYEGFINEVAASVQTRTEIVTFDYELEFED